MLNTKLYWTLFTFNCFKWHLGFFWTSVLSLKNCHFICGNINQGCQLRHNYYTEIHHSILTKGTSFPLSFSCHKPLVRNQCISRTAFLHSLILSILLLCLHTYVKNKICTHECKRIPEHVRIIHRQYGGVVRSTNTAARLPELEFQLCPY